MMKVSQNKEFDDENLRELGFEVVVSFCERKKAFFEKDTDKFKLFIEELFKYMLEMDEEVTEEWSTPAGESYFDEEVISEEKVATGISFLERLLECYSGKIMLPFISEIVLNFLKNTSDYRYKYIAFTTIVNMLDYVEDIKEIENIIPVSL